MLETSCLIKNPTGLQYITAATIKFVLDADLLMRNLPTWGFSGLKSICEIKDLQSASRE